MPNMKKNMNSC